MQLNKKEIEYIKSKFGMNGYDACRIIQAYLDNTDIIIRKRGRDARLRLIKTERARYYVGTEKFCDGLIEAYQRGRSRQHSVDTDATLFFFNLKDMF